MISISESHDVGTTVMEVVSNRLIMDHVDGTSLMLKRNDVGSEWRQTPTAKKCSGVEHKKFQYLKRDDRERGETSPSKETSQRVNVNT